MFKTNYAFQNADGEFIEFVKDMCDIPRSSLIKFDKPNTIMVQTPPLVRSTPNQAIELADLKEQLTKRGYFAEMFETAEYSKGPQYRDTHPPCDIYTENDEGLGFNGFTKTLIQRKSNGQVEIRVVFCAATSTA